MEISTTLYQAALVMHITGITIMAGATFIDFITFRNFCSIYKTDQAKSYVLENFLNKLQRYMGIGMLVIIISGVVMMVKLHEVWGAQIWFRVKIIVLLFIIINGLGLRRMVGSKLRKVMTNNSSTGSAPVNFNSIKKNLILIQVIQMLLFVLIYVLSVYKFN